MPKFVTISPTHIAGQKQHAWDQFVQGNYIAIGWMHVDLTGKTMDEIIEIIKMDKYENEASAIDAFKKFFQLSPGDYVAVNNSNAGLFGVGTVTSDYRFQQYKHDTGVDDNEEFYSHYRTVDWKTTAYVRRKDTIGEGEIGWQPYGTMGILLPEPPLYIRRLLGEEIKVDSTEQPESVVPEFLSSIVNMIERLKSDGNHQERAHEFLVEDLLVALGYEKHSDIKYRQGRVDVTIWAKGAPVAVIEVKRDWGLSRYRSKGAIVQAYNYAHDQGIRYVIITNGDYYAIFDRLKGLSYESNVIGEFRLTAMSEEDLSALELLRRDKIGAVNIKETLSRISESFA